MNVRLSVWFVCFIVIFSIISSISARTSNELRITLPNGSKLVGRQLRSHEGRPIKAFLGIPYAKPPVGHLRFKAPEPAEKWEGEFFAVKDGPICVQRDPFRRNHEIEGSENCLALNVYTPHSYDRNKTSNLPVMVFFHGGGFQCGSGIRPFYGPDYLLDYDVIYIGANFRLGPLGFLSSEQEDCPGNFGLKDQVLVLKWIQNNIKAFGGDPASVTVFGESAGGASATYLMMSPLAKGLFSKAIAQSGTNLAAWSQPAHKGVARSRAIKLAESFKCYTPQSWPKTLDCLRSVSAENVTAAFYDFFMWDTDPMIPFPPVVEPDIPGAFITKHPRDDGHNENSLKIPFMTGLTFDEGAMKSAPLFNLPGLFDDFSTNLSSVLPIALNYDHHETLVQEWITRKINEYYFANDLSREKQKNVTNLFTDGWFLEAMDQYLELRLSHENIAPTYVYLFTHKGSASFTEIFKGGQENYWGVSHAEELQYLFPIADGLFISALPTKEDEEIRKAITQLWVNFASTGNPTPDSSDLPKWEEANGFPLKYYRIGNSNHNGKSLIGMEIDGIFHDRANFWRQIGAHLPTRIFEKDEL
ncbi:venom carboxylesterase-6 [Contarinia nasturtii]|uniref:venom carboxylesterase-6 n=1 Tax=Contarinia nasturtii TaxID=265458 RepID=UPI0012D405FE|nr:venom carboxylesterase-6 [Contarinia nasturtii]